jgi:hypothetical protein
VKLTTDVNNTFLVVTARYSLSGDTVVQSDVLNYVDADVISLPNCSRQFLTWCYVTKDMIVLLVKEMCRCRDTGGPLVADDEMMSLSESFLSEWTIVFQDFQQLSPGSLAIWTG